LAVQFGASAASSPAPSVQPVLSLLVFGKPGVDAWILPNAAPPVMYGMKRCGIAEPSAHRGKPGIAGLATQRTRIVGGAVDAGPIDVAFDAGDHLAELIIVADSAADQTAADVAAPRRILRRSA
jgi:hypothetical protein